MKKIILLVVFLLCLPFQSFAAGTNEPAPDGWIQLNYIIPVSQGFDTGIRYSATISEILGLATGMYDAYGAASTSMTDHTTTYDHTKIATALQPTDVNDTPVDGVTIYPISSNWAYDHINGADPHTQYLLESLLSADGLSLITSTDKAAMRTFLGMGTSYSYDVGTAIGDLPVLVDGGGGVPSLPIGTFNPDLISGYKLAGANLITTTVADPGSDSKVPTEAAVRAAITAGGGGGTISATEQSSDPTAAGMSTGDLIVSTSSGDMFYKSATGFYTFPGTYTVDPTTYSLTIDLVDGNSTDKITYLSTDYTTDQTFTGLTAQSTFSITPDTGRTYSFSGTGCSDSSGNVTCPTDSQDSSAQITFSDIVAGCTGSTIFQWHMEDADVTVGTPAGCATYDTTATLQSGAVIDATQYYDGTHSLGGDGSYARADFDTDQNLIDDCLFKGRFRFTTYSSAVVLFQQMVDSSNVVKIQTSASSTDTNILIGVSRFGNGTSTSTYLASGGRSIGEWFYVEAAWKAGVAGNDTIIKVCDADGVSNCTQLEEDNDNPASIGTPTSFSISANYAVTMDGFVDDVEVHNASGY